MDTNQRSILYKELQRLISTLKIRNGELNIEVIIDKSNRPHFLELGPRAGGNMIPIQLSDCFGIDLIEANVRAALGEAVALKPISPNDSFMTFVLHSHHDGVFSKVEYDNTILPYIYRTVLYKKEGELVQSFDGAGKALGIVFMKFPTVREMNSAEKHIDELIKVILK